MTRSTPVIAFEPHHLLRQCEEVVDWLNALAVSRYLEDQHLLGAVERLRELHRKLDACVQRQRLEAQLKASVARLGEARELASSKPQVKEKP